MTASTDTPLAATPPDDDTPSASPEVKRLDRVRRGLRAFLIGWRAVVVFIFFSLLGGVVIIPFFKTPEQYLDGVRDQFAGLLASFQADPLRASGITGGLLFVTLVSEISYRGAKRAETAAAERARQQASDLRDAGLQRQIDALAERLVDAPLLPPHVVAPEGLPLPGGNLIGRDAELQEVLQRLRAGQTTEVVAVQGTPTIGKTALAAVAVRTLAQETATFPGGAIWVSAEGLEGASGLNELWSKIALALGAEAIARQNDPAVKRRLLHYALHAPGRPRLLIAIDNLEPGLDEAALLDTLAGGQATLLLTARHLLAPGRVQRVELHELNDDDAERLFRRRLAQVQPDRGADDAATRRRVARGLGGLPTAIELAASYAGVHKLALEALEAEMARDGLHTGPLEKLRAAFDRSWRVLTPAQRRLFAGLSLLQGASFPREAGVAVALAAVVGGGRAGARGERGGGGGRACRYR